MNSAELLTLYEELRTRVNFHVPGSMKEISVRLPATLGSEIAFFRLVNWSYVLVQEAAKLPLDFLTQLSQLKARTPVRSEVSTLRTYVAHNLEGTSARTTQQRAAAFAWFNAACGAGSPQVSKHYRACCRYLARKVYDTLSAALAACDILSFAEDGPRLVDDLRQRVNSNWEAYRFDAIVESSAEDLMCKHLDLKAFRERNLEAFRAAVKVSPIDEQERAARIAIEAKLLREIKGSLPLTADEVSKFLGFRSREALIASLLLLVDVPSEAGRVSDLLRNTFDALVR